MKNLWFMLSFKDVRSSFCYIITSKDTGTMIFIPLTASSLLQRQSKQITRTIYCCPASDRFFQEKHQSLGMTRNFLIVICPVVEDPAVHNPTGARDLCEVTLGGRILASLVQIPLLVTSSDSYFLMLLGALHWEAMKVGRRWYCICHQVPHGKDIVYAHDLATLKTRMDLQTQGSPRFFWTYCLLLCVRRLAVQITQIPYYWIYIESLKEKPSSKQQE